MGPMNSEILNILEKADTRSWKTLSLPFGAATLTIQVPPDYASLRMRAWDTAILSAEEIRQRLHRPIGSPSLGDIIRAKPQPVDQTTVCITVSDITRPVPYRGEGGLLAPLLKIVEDTGVLRSNIVILVGNGMHRASTRQEKIRMYGEAVVERYRLEDHDCEDLSRLVRTLKTASGTEVFLNASFYHADVKIVTGLVESHFMAGVSGGRKGVCPALVNTRTIEQFHGPVFLEHPKATNLVLEGNPCHEESLEVAQSVGVDFLVNATLDSRLRLTGVFAGDLVEAHEAAVGAMKPFVQIPVPEPFDIVLTHGGYVGRNHYQCVKAAVGAMAAVREGGMILLLADNSDAEPIGSQEYKTLLHLFKILGPDGYVSMLRHPDWVFTKDQWEPEMWGRPFRKVGFDGMIYCSPQIPEEAYQIIPGLSGYDVIEKDMRFDSPEEKVTAMLQNAVCYAAVHPRFAGQQPSIAFVEDGPYAIPVPTESTSSVPSVPIEE